MNLRIEENNPLVMGIINCTPDSFYHNSRYNSLESAAREAKKMIDHGAHIIDIGGESTRPGSDYINPKEEIERTVPVIKAIRKFSDIPISIDTRKSAVAIEAYNEGANIINDVSALQDDPHLGEFAGENNIPVILMHKKGIPKNMQDSPYYENVIEEIKNCFIKYIKNAKTLGIIKKNIILDPGIGFGKRQEDNLLIIKNLSEFKELGCPLLMGLSRKSFIGNILKNEPNERLIGSITANAISVLNGANILRVHDVKETVEMIKVLKSIEGLKG